jgi:hypothetical protein
MKAPLRVPTRTRTPPLGLLTFELAFFLCWVLRDVVLSEVVLSEGEGRRGFFLVFTGVTFFVVGDFVEVKEEVVFLIIG